MPTRADLVQARPDGNRIFMVVFELATLLYALVFAYPHIPTTLIDETGRQREFNWTSVLDNVGLRDAIRGLLRTSDTLEACRATGGAADAVDELAAVCDPHALSALYRLNLSSDEVPLTTRQMVEAVCRVYQKLTELELSTREELIALLRHHQFVPNATRLRPNEKNSRTHAALLTFCTELAVDWMQPFFARNARFYIPPALAQSSFAARTFTATVAPQPVPLRAAAM